jgi:regulatory protein
LARRRLEPYSYALRLLSLKPRTKKELTEALKKRGTPGKEIEVILTRLEDLGYIDDIRYAEVFSRFGARERIWGRFRILLEMKKRGIAEDVAEEAVSRYFSEDEAEEDILKRALEKRLRVAGHPKDMAQFKRFYDYLARKGFPSGLIISALADFRKEHKEEWSD